jgi:hypothetical protein
MNKEFRTTILPEASYLLTLGYEPLEVVSSKDTILKTFVFPAACKEVVAGYHNDELVPAKSYQQAFQAVLRMMHAA